VVGLTRGEAQLGGARLVASWPRTQAARSTGYGSGDGGLSSGLGSVSERKVGKGRRSCWW